MSAARTSKRIGVKSKFAGKTPASTGATKGTLRGGNKREEFCFGNRFSIETIIANHFEMLVRDMNDKTLNELKNGNFLHDETIIIMPVVVKSNRRTIVRINTRGGNNGSTKISRDVLSDDRRIAVAVLGVNIEAFGMLIIHLCAGSLKRWAEFGTKEFEQGSTKRVAKEFKIEMDNSPPEERIAHSPFGNEGMNMRIPLKRTSEGMKDTNKSGNEMFRLIEVEKHTKDNRLNGMKKTVE